MSRLPLILTAATVALPASAEVPHVMTDIAPVHSLVAQVMGDLGTPDLLVDPGMDAHNVTLRPSVARQLDAADLVVQVGPGLTPWLEEPLENLAADATVLTLLETDGWTPIAYEHHDHENHGDHAKGEGHSDHDHGEEDHTEHDHTEGHDHSDHDHGEDHSDHNHGVEDHGEEDHAHKASAEGYDHHDHGDTDPHAWLDPTIAAVWVEAIREALSDADPENAATYEANASAALSELDALNTEVRDLLASGTPGTWLAPHNAFGYFEAHFDFPAAGAVADGEAVSPGPAEVADLRTLVENGTVTCVLSETDTNDNRARTLTEGTEARMAMVNGTGAGLEPGPALYGDLLRNIAQTLADCTAR